MHRKAYHIFLNASYRSHAFILWLLAVRTVPTESQPLLTHPNLHSSPGQWKGRQIRRRSGGDRQPDRQVSGVV